MVLGKFFFWGTRYTINRGEAKLLLGKISIFTCEKHVYKRHCPSVGPSVGPLGPTSFSRKTQIQVNSKQIMIFRNYWSGVGLVFLKQKNKASQTNLHRSSISFNISINILMRMFYVVTKITQNSHS